MLDMLSSTNNKVGYIWVADVGHFSQAPKPILTDNHQLSIKVAAPASKRPDFVCIVSAFQVNAGIDQSARRAGAARFALCDQFFVA